ncbi:related to Guanyl-specific ribonuclease F1 [Rhynchosporium agropyri]|uniref:ribonuclease T1 n=3 Tax=Rhynchosporium TaxID=38037 RepID=A0A1E1MQL7_RHYSE|nr:related to Guanyl-specific ribonuclease F1 [Rhynchosporium commune]CZT08183.1 related to Guanyl-specific ribonuclease F1 [Rhynchosporium agropyri]CZT51397.1 related to Guanyl-specific ribonuclease F1 [Rhynchosporium secalis]
MFELTTLLPLVLLFTTSTSLPVLEERAAATCGSVLYSAAAVSAASSKACSYYKAGSAPGGYPHTYRNYEGFEFGSIAGPYQEFPILKSGALYSGGSPGADRVIITTSCKQVGTITHTGASGNNFVACTGTT